MSVVVLGGGGNIGYWVEKKFLEEKWELLSISRGNRENKREFNENFSYLTLLKADINASDKYIETQINNSDLIIDFICFNQKDAESRIKLLSQFTGVYLMISTVAVYDRTEGMNTISSATACDDLKWGYAKNKFEAELFLLNNLKNCNVRILRLGHTYDTALPVPFGPSDWTIPDWLLKGNPLLMFRRDNNSWPLLHSIDAANRIYFIATNPDVFSKYINVVSNSPTSWDRIGSAFFHCLGLTENFSYLSVDALCNAYPHWSNSVYFHKQFSEKYVGDDQDVLNHYFPDSLDVNNGLAVAIKWYLSDKSYRQIDSEAYSVLNSLVKLCYRE